jgi:bifunctional DNase/RNase
MRRAAIVVLAAVIAFALGRCTAPHAAESVPAAAPAVEPAHPAAAPAPRTDPPVAAATPTPAPAPLRACAWTLSQRPSDQDPSGLVTISERTGARCFTISIGAPEALAIGYAVDHVAFPRPLTHDLLVQVLRATGCSCREARIQALKDGVFVGDLVLVDAAGGEHHLDCRPSDALAVIVRLPGADLLVAEPVLDEGASEQPPATPPEPPPF